MMKNIVVFILLIFVAFTGNSQTKKKVVKKQVVAKKIVVKPSTQKIETKDTISKKGIEEKTILQEQIAANPEVLAQYPGGYDSLKYFLSKNINYPEVSIESEVQGKVLVLFKVCADGQLCNLKVVKSLSKETDAEAIRVIKKMKSWTPAKLNGQPVASYYSLPIKFKLSSE